MSATKGTNLALQPLATTLIVQLLHQKRIIRLALGFQFAIRRSLLLLTLLHLLLSQGFLAYLLLAIRLRLLAHAEALLEILHAALESGCSLLQLRGQRAFTLQ